MRADDEGNMNEKMTDEALSELLAHIRMELGHGAESDLGAHIAALTAELDEAVKREKMTRESIRETHLDMDNARCPGTNRPIEERIHLLWEERDEARKEREQFRADLVRMSEFAFQGGTGSPVTQEGTDALEGIGGLWNKADTLRERVQALEAQCTKLAQERDAEWTTRRAAESRLAAILRRAGDTKALVEAHQSGMGCASVARYILGDDARPLAPPEAFTHEKGLDAGVFEEAAKGCGLCPGCTDENWADGDLCDAATVRDMERTDYKAPPAMGVLSTPTATDPTTSEAFAFLREDAAYLRRGHPHTVGRMERMLSLLERRMGAQQRALEETLKLHHRMPGDIIRMIQDALTDAPLVFTLGEVKEALTEHIGDLPAAVNEVVARLTALRK